MAASKVQRTKEELEVLLLEERLKRERLTVQKLRNELKAQDDEFVQDEITENSPLILNAAVTPAMFSTVLSRFYYKLERAHEDINIILNSPGGYVIEGLAIVDAIESAKLAGAKVNIIAQGEVASMGGVILQAGSTRIITPNSLMMIHEVSSGSFGKTSELQDELKLVQRLQEKCLSILAQKSTLSKSQIRTKWKKTDWWLSAEETVDLGFADRVGTSF